MLLLFSRDLFFLFTPGFSRENKQAHEKLSQSWDIILGTSHMCFHQTQNWQGQHRDWFDRQLVIIHLFSWLFPLRQIVILVHGELPQSRKSLYKNRKHYMIYQ